MGVIQTQFNATRAVDTKVVSLDHFPPLVYALCSEHGLAHGQLSFTRGQWDAAKWAMPPFSPTSSGFQFHGWLSTHHGTEPYDTCVSS